MREKKKNNNADCSCILGDFNSVRVPSKRVGIGGEDGGGEREEFNNFIQEMGVEDIPITTKKCSFMMHILKRLMSHGGNFVIKENDFFYGTHSKMVLRNRFRMYDGVIRRNKNDDRFMCKSVVVFFPVIT